MNFVIILKSLNWHLSGFLFVVRILKFNISFLTQIRTQRDAELFTNILPTEIPTKYSYDSLSSMYKFIGRLFGGERGEVEHGEKATAFGCVYLFSVDDEIMK